MLGGEARRGLGAAPCDCGRRQLLYYMVNNDPVAVGHKRQMEELHQFVEAKHLPPDLAGRVVRHFEFQYQKAVENRASASVELPRPARARRARGLEGWGVEGRIVGFGTCFLGLRFFCDPRPSVAVLWHV